MDELFAKHEYNNIFLFFDLSIKDSSQIIIDIITKFNESDEATCDEHPFFIFYTKKNDITKKAIFNEVRVLQKDFTPKEKVDIRNIDVTHELDKIYSIVIEKYNYFNQIEFNIDYSYDTSCTINILFAGNSGTGKSTFINRLLGEKKAFVCDTDKTEIYNEYYHKYIPIKLYDSIGFEVGKNAQKKDLRKKKNHVILSKK